MKLPGNIHRKENYKVKNYNPNNWIWVFRRLTLKGRPYYIFLFLYTFKDNLFLLLFSQMLSNVVSISKNHGMDWLGFVFDMPNVEPPWSNS